MRAEKEADEDSPWFVDFLNGMSSDCSCKAICRVISGGVTTAVLFFFTDIV